LIRVPACLSQPAILRQGGHSGSINWTLFSAAFLCRIAPFPISRYAIDSRYSDSHHFDLIGIAIGRAQAQYPMGTMHGGAKRAANRCHRLDARKEQD
jgi:hypothetical protein